MKRLILISAVWPEIRSSAAGMRSWSLIEIFKMNNLNDITIISPAKPTSYTKELEDKFNIITKQINANDNKFDEYIKEYQPDVVIFDQFTLEEMFGWRVYKHCPNALRIIDTQDLHFLRKIREKHMNEYVSSSKLVDYNYSINSSSNLLVRELSAMLRSDLNFIVSTYEMGLLQTTFQVPTNKLCLSPFYYKENLMKLNSYSQRKNFVSIGNFLHHPNIDSYKILKDIIWPKIKSQIPNATLNIFGAHANQKQINELEDMENDLFICGYTPNIYDELNKHRVMLAPLRYGAGIKGKISDSWWSGLPVVTTSIGVEGMIDSIYPKILICDHVDKFVEVAVDLYENEKKWRKYQTSGFQMVNKYFDFNKNYKILWNIITNKYDNMTYNREKDWLQAILFQNSLQATKYLSKYILEKNKSKK